MKFRPLMKVVVARTPGADRLRKWYATRRKKSGIFVAPAEYWQLRYGSGGNSGSGSYGALADFKAATINQFVTQYHVTSVIEFGCGDGNQLKIGRYPKYIGLDVAPEAIRLCKEMFAADNTKSFYLYDSACFVDNAQLFFADATMSLDVLFHLVEDRTFEQYLTHLFQCAKRYVIIYSSNQDIFTNSAYERNRVFSNYVTTNFPEWRLLKKVENKYPFSKYPEPLGSFADFYFYERILEQQANLLMTD